MRGECNPGSATLALWRIKCAQHTQQYYICGPTPIVMKLCVTYRDMLKSMNKETSFRVDNGVSRAKTRYLPTFRLFSGSVQGRGLRLLAPVSTIQVLKVSPAASSKLIHVQLNFYAPIRSSWRDMRLNAECIIFGYPKVCQVRRWKQSPAIFYISRPVPLRL